MSRLLLRMTGIPGLYERNPRAKSTRTSEATSKSVTMRAIGDQPHAETLRDGSVVPVGENTARLTWKKLCDTDQCKKPEAIIRGIAYR